jgi:hypothetical protein
MRLKPMRLGETYCTIIQANLGNAFQFSPSAFAVPLSQHGKDTNTTAGSYRLNIRNLTDDFKAHHSPAGDFKAHHSPAGDVAFQRWSVSQTARSSLTPSGK